MKVESASNNKHLNNEHQVLPEEIAHSFCFQCQIFFSKITNLSLDSESIPQFSGNREPFHTKVILKGHGIMHLNTGKRLRKVN